MRVTHVKTVANASYNFSGWIQLYDHYLYFLVFNFNEKSSLLSVFCTTQSNPSFKVDQKFPLLNSFVVYTKDILYAIMQSQNLSFFVSPIRLQDIISVFSVVLY